jgi:hypothetical protein
MILARQLESDNSQEQEISENWHSELAIHAH